jgi:hypothetical protein
MEETEEPFRGSIRSEPPIEIRGAEAWAVSGRAGREMRAEIARAGERREKGRRRESRGGKVGKSEKNVPSSTGITNRKLIAA